MSIEALKSTGIGAVEGRLKPQGSVNSGRPGEFAQNLQEALQGPLGQQVAPTPHESNLKFSNHAVERMRSRGMSFSQDVLQKIEGAVDMAKGKGAKEALVLAEDSAMIVNVENRTVVTVMNKELLRENVFTNIDAAVLI